MALIVLAGEFNADCISDNISGDFSLIKAENRVFINCPEAVVILGGGAFAEINAALGVIANGDEPSEDLPRGVQLITCGVSPKNTVSITSRTPEKITLSLNRSIRAKNGVIEPLEQPEDINSAFKEYEQMAAFAARLLLN